MLTRSERKSMASDIISAMRDAYEQEGVEGDFDDGYRHLSEDATDGELQADYDKWCTK